MVLIVIALASILLMGALALDGGHMLLNKTRLQNAVDAAALSGAKTLQQVTGSGNAYIPTQTAALNTLRINADAEGNAELAAAVAKAGGVGNFAVVELADSVYGPFSSPGPADARFVRVRVWGDGLKYDLTGFLWNLAKSFSAGALGDKAVTAIATAGLAPTAVECKIEPIMVCGDTSQPPDPNDPDSPYWGYGVGDLEVLKSAAGNAPMAEGNFQLLRLDGASGADDLRTALAGGIDQCIKRGDEVPTEPGNTVGPVAQGLNTRFGEYNGPGMNATTYPPDWVIEVNDQRLTYNDSTTPPQVEYDGQPVTSSGGDLMTANGPLYDLNDWGDDSAACLPDGCQPGLYGRRMLNIVIGDCTNLSGGQIDVPVLGVGCFYLLQTVAQSGVEAQIFGQFDKECEGDGYVGSGPSNNTTIPVLYKTYFSGVSTPSPDS